MGHSVHGQKQYCCSMKGGSLTSPVYCRGGSSGTVSAAQSTGSLTTELSCCNAVNTAHRTALVLKCVLNILLVKGSVCS